MADPDDNPSATRSPMLSRRVRSWLVWGIVILGALAISFGIRGYLIQTFSIPSASMVPTLQVGDRILVNKQASDLSELSRGDIVVFEKPETLASDLDHLVKRMIGLPGDTVEGRDGQVWIDGEPLAEPWLPDGVVTDAFGPVVVPDGEVFFMGDNRTQSQDSRVFGTVSADNIVGRVFFRIWPLDRVGSIDGG